ncbi:hypothetical protein WJX82_007311 [Trebouxia sp. C0006]
MAVPKTASNQPGCDRTPTSRLDQTKAAVLSSQSSKGVPEVVLTPMSASGSVNSARGTPVLFANKNSLSVFGSPALTSRDQEQASNGENIKVVIRVRPLQIKGTASQECLRLSGSMAVTLLVGSDDTTFTFDHVAGPQTTQEQFFRVVGRPMVENVLSGYNSCIFAYGQTGSGKTHTMLGQLSPLASGDTMPEEAGLIPRIFAYLFAYIENVQSKQREGREVCFLCKCSFLEIYKEVITDLLNPAATRLHIRENLQQGVHVEGLSQETVTSAQAVMQLLSAGAQNRHVAATKANADSSRSHCVFTCVVESKCTEDGVTSIKTSCLNLVDLAGSERQKVAEGEGERVKEAGSINRSLASLGLVIKKLVEGNGPGAPAIQQTHIPYRDSRLTFLLQDSLGGNAKTVMVANVSPAAACLKETHSTLGFAHRAKMIRNKAVVNEDTTADALLLQKENERLRKELEMYRQLQQACTPTPPRRESTPLAVAKVRQEAELAEAEVAAVWAGQLAAALELNQDLEDNVVRLRQQNASLKRERKAMEGEVRQMQADMQALGEADLDAQQRAQAAEARAEAVTVQGRQQRSHAVHAEAQLEEASASVGDGASMQDTSLVYNPADAQLISQVASLKTQLQNGDTHAVELKKRLAGSEAERDSLTVAAQQLQQAMQQQSLAMQNVERDHQASLQERDALRNKNGQQKAELQQAAVTIQQLQSAAAGLADDLQSASAQVSAAAQLRRDLDAQRAQHVDLTEKLLALEAQVAYKQHKLDALQKDVSSTNLRRDALQADLIQSQQQGASQMLLPESKSVADELPDHLAEQAEPTQRISQETQTSFQDSDASNRLQQLTLAAEQHAGYKSLQEQLMLEADAKLQTQMQARQRGQEQLEAAADALKANQERTVQSLRVAADATAREKILLTNQLDSTEQQLTIQAQELLGQQRETHRLQAAQKDQAVYLKKAQLKGSSNEHGLRGLQQRLQEALQDKKSAELKVPDMQARLQEAELAVSQAEHMVQHLHLHAQRIHSDGTDRLGIVDDRQRGFQTSAGSVHRHHQSTQTSVQAEDKQEACCHTESDAQQADETEAREAALKGSLQDRDDLILDLDNQIKALEVQITGAFAEHEARLGQQQEALARQSQKGLSTMQTRINALQATLAADSAQHAAAYADVQRQNERLQHDKESAYAKVAAVQRQAQGSEGRALGAEQTVAALQQDLASWQGRYKKRDCELASQTSKVAMLQSLQQSAAEAQAGLAAANSKAASASKALSQAQQELHQMHDAYRRREGEVQRWKGLASQARAEGQSLQAKRDEEAALYADQVQQLQEKLSNTVRNSSHSTSPLLHRQLAQLLQERDAILAHNHRLTGQLEVTAGEQNQEALLQQQHVALTAEKVAAVQAVQQQLEQAKLEHAAVMSQLRALHSSALEEVRRLRLTQKA